MAGTDDERIDTTSGFADNWQAGKTIAECNMRMLSSEDSCDVIFQIGTDEHVVKAHRYILISRSCQFHKKLCLPKQKKDGGHINIKDTGLEIFMHFLTYLYKDDIQIDSTNVAGLLDISRTYDVTELERKCLEHQRKEGVEASNTSQVSPDNWQSGMNLAECNLHMFQTQDNCDVTFRVDSDGHVVKAHKYVLVSRSCVFHTMLADTQVDNHEIDIPDMNAGHFKQFLVYLYTDSTTVKSDNATSLLHASRKYAVSSLEKECLKYLESSLNIDNACEILETAFRYEYEELYDASLAFVKFHGQKCLQTPGFLNLSQELVGEIIKSHELVAFGHVVFSAIDQWSEKECQRQGREVNPKSKRAVLGSTLERMTFSLDAPLIRELKANRFISHLHRKERMGYLMSEFGTMNMAGHLLYREMDENGDENEQDLSNVTPNLSERRYCETRNFYNYYGLPDAIVFRCNKNIFLHGFQLYGPLRDSGSYDLMTNILDQKGRPVLSSVLESSYTTSASDDVFDVMYKKPVKIKAEKWYTLLVKILGPDSKAGNGGLLQITCPEDVVFDFRNSDKSKNGTSITVGQIPAFLYSVQ